MKPEKIFIENEVAIKLKYYTKFAKGEVSGMGKSVINEDGDIEIVDIALFDQECTGAHTDIDDESLAKFMHEMHQAGESLENWNVWWHTHADFGVSWSSTDDTCVKDHLNNHDYLVSIVTNKAGDFKGRLDVTPKDNSPFRKSFEPKQYDLDVEYFVNTEQKKEVEDQVEALELEKMNAEDYIKEVDEKIEKIESSLLEDEVLEKECEEEVKEKVREKVWQATRSYNSSGQGYYLNGKYYSTKKSKKKESYYENDAEKQRDFENALDDIIWGYPIFEREEYETLDERLENMQQCAECQNPIVYCQCDDASAKWGEMLSMEDDPFGHYLDNQFKQRIELDDYHEDHGNFRGKNSILPIIFKKNGK